MAEFSHYGTPRHSGRYKWGSGEDPQQRNKSFLGMVDELAKKGLSEVEIAKGVGMNVTQLRNKKSLLKTEQRKADIAEANKLKAKGYSNVEIGKRMKLNESSVRALLNPALKERSEITNTISNMLKDSVEKNKYIDVGVGTERHLGISRTKLKIAISQLEEDGYKLNDIKVQQLGTGKQTSILVLTKSDVEYKDLYRNRDKIKMITDQTSKDHGRSFLGLEPIKNVDSKRILIRYNEEGGAQKDGVIELRRGVDDISLGNVKYAQVRVGVDGTHYLKGMAVYADDMPKGVDIIYNTNKKVGTVKEKVFKPMSDDPDNPFGTTIKAGGQRGVLNIVNEEGDWGKWSKTLSSQVLSKQSVSLAKKQLDSAYDAKKNDYDDIIKLTNPTVKKKLLEDFSDGADAATIHLKAAALPRQRAQVILPLPSIKENQIYAPNFRDGEQVVLIRHPHGGIFEIPELTVNNKNQEAGRIMKGAIDAVGIHPKTAEKLSGADFDGDTVLVIPNNNKSIKTSPSLKGLIDFDPKVSYGPHDGMKTIDGGIYNAKTDSVDYNGKRPNSYTKGIQMGDISNLITDMTIRGANNDEIAKAVRHSMVVIDAEKHKLDYKLSYMENQIGSLKKLYQGSERSGATTLISRASSQQSVALREEGKKVLNPETGVSKRVYVDPETGKKLYEYVDGSYIDKQGKTKFKTTKSTKMAEVDDAFQLSSGTPIESVYANYANKLKALANDARKEALITPSLVYSPSAKQIYKKEVDSLNAKLNVALKNSPLERQAQLLANSVVDLKKQANPFMEKGEIKKIKGQALIEARTRVGAKKESITIEPKEWEAIQAGAISDSNLKKILNNTDMDKIKQLSTPRQTVTLSPAKQTKARTMLAAGRTMSEVADDLGVSVSVISRILES